MTTSRYRRRLPPLDGRAMLSDSGLETSLIYHEGFDLPDFAAFVLLDSKPGRAALRRYYQRHVDLAIEHSVGFVLETPTWRASRDWGKRLGYDDAALAAVNRDAVAMMSEWRDRHDEPRTPYVISGNVGPRGDGYDPDSLMMPAEAETYHADQIRVFAEAGVDLIGAVTMTHVGETVGIVRAARARDLPVVIAFTVETDGRLPSGQPLADAIDEVDAATDAAVAYFMINCAHPDHFRDTVAATGEWRRRVLGLRANASRKSHAELDASTDLDDGDPAELGTDYASLRTHLPNLSVFGGCCGTDHRHIAAIASRCLPIAAGADARHNATAAASDALR